MTDTGINRVVYFAGGEADLCAMQKRYMDSLFVHGEQVVGLSDCCKDADRAIRMRLAMLGRCDEFWYPQNGPGKYGPELVFCKQYEIKTVAYAQPQAR